MDDPSPTPDPRVDVATRPAYLLLAVVLPLHFVIGGSLQAASAPFGLAFGAGGALETIVDGETGRFFREPTVDALADVLAGFPRGGWDARTIRRNAERFDNSVFKEQLAGFVDHALASHGAGLTRASGDGCDEGGNG